MAKQTAVNFTTNTTKQIAVVNKPSNGATSYIASIAIEGTFGSGSVTLQVSFDGGTTKTNITADGYGTIPSYTVPCVVGLTLGNGNKNSASPILYATLSGSSGASVNVTVCDNIG